MATKEKLGRLPSLPGVYIFKGSKGEVLYIGKAKSLKPRVRSYFSKSTQKSDTRYAIRFLAERTEDIEYIVTTNEKEALILEDTLLKKHRPRYNIRLKDDKTYLSIKLTVNEEFPRILTTRRVKKDGSRYFGPYASAGKARETVKILRRIFPLCV
jgi:excinuclease ABC subunit C